MLPVIGLPASIYVDTESRSEQPDGSTRANAFRRLERAYRSTEKGDVLKLGPTTHSVSDGFRFNKQGRIEAYSQTARIATPYVDPCPSVIYLSAITEVVTASAQSNSGSGAPSQAFVESERLVGLGSVAPSAGSPIAHTPIYTRGRLSVVLAVEVNTDKPANLNYYWSGSGVNEGPPPEISPDSSDPRRANVRLPSQGIYDVRIEVSCGARSVSKQVRIDTDVIIDPSCVACSEVGSIVVSENFRVNILQPYYVASTITRACNIPISEPMWTVLTKPKDSNPTIKDSDHRGAFITVDREGEYVFAVECSYRTLVGSRCSTTLLRDVFTVVGERIVPPSSVRVTQSVNEALGCRLPTGIGSTERPIAEVQLEARAFRNSILVPNNLVSYSWSPSLKPPGASVSFSPPSASATTVGVDSIGEYVFKAAARLKGSNELLGEDQVTYVVRSNCRPFVNVGSNPSPVDFPDSVPLNGSAEPNGAPIKTVEWRVVLSPPGGTVQFQPQNATQTTAKFLVPGDYVLALKAATAYSENEARLAVTVKDAASYLETGLGGSCAAGVGGSQRFVLRNTHPRKAILATIDYELKTPVDGWQNMKKTFFLSPQGGSAFVACIGGGTLLRNERLSGSFSGTSSRLLLSFGESSDEFSFSWPPTEPRTVVESTTSLEADAVWQQAEEEGPQDDPFLTDGLHQARLLGSEGVRFFRLRPVSE